MTHDNPPTADTGLHAGMVIVAGSADDSGAQAEPTAHEHMVDMTVRRSEGSESSSESSDRPMFTEARGG